MGIAVLLAQKEIGYTVIERSRKGPGFDSWMGEGVSEPFQHEALLEISGIRKGCDRDDASQTQAEAKTLTDRSDGSLPAFVIVVEFEQHLY